MQVSSLNLNYSSLQKQEQTIAFENGSANKNLSQSKPFYQQTMKTSSYLNMNNNMMGGNDILHQSMDNLQSFNKNGKQQTKINPWGDFALTSATLTKNLDEDSNTFNKEKRSSGFTTTMNLSQINFRKKIGQNKLQQQQKLQMYNFPPNNNEQINDSVLNNDKKQQRDLVIQDKFFQQSINNQKLNKCQGSIKDFLNEDSLCITEENRFENVVNPIKLADLAWGDDYKLDKLTKQQDQLDKDGMIDLEQYFGGFEISLWDEAFQNIQDVNQYMEEDFKYQSGDFLLNSMSQFLRISQPQDNNQTQQTTQQQNQLISYQQPILQQILSEKHIYQKGGGSLSSSDDDAAENFVQQTINHLQNRDGFPNKNKHKKNLLLKDDISISEQDERYQLGDQMNESEPIYLEQEYDFNRRTPKILDNDDNNDNNQDNKDNKESKKKQKHFQFKNDDTYLLMQQELIVEESKEESFILEQLAQNSEVKEVHSQQIAINGNDNYANPKQILQMLKEQDLAQVQKQQNSQEQDKIKIIQDNEDQLKEEVYQEVEPVVNNRLYDSDIFVMSNTTFDEELMNNSRRASDQGTNKQHSKIVDFIKYFDNKNTKQDNQAQKDENSTLINGITSKLFIHQHAQQMNERRQKKYQQNHIGNNKFVQSASQQQLTQFQNHKQSYNHNQSQKQLPTQFSKQNLNQQQHQNTQQNASNINNTSKQHNVSHIKQQSSTTKLSNYLSSSNNLILTPNAYQKAFKKFKEGRNIQQDNKLYQKQKLYTQYNSMSSFNFGQNREGNVSPIGISTMFNNHNNNVNNKNTNQTQIVNNSQFNQTSHFKQINYQTQINQVKFQKQYNYQQIKQIVYQMQLTNNGKNVNQNQINLAQKIKRFGKSNSNDSLTNKNLMQINTTHMPMQTKVSYHSPQDSIFVRQNLSPGPSYKIKERNSMFDQKNSNSSQIEKNAKFVMVKPSQFCSASNEIMTKHKQKQKVSQSNKRGVINKNQSLTQSKDFSIDQQSKIDIIDSSNMINVKSSITSDKCIIDTNSYPQQNNMATHKLLSNIKQSILSGKQQQKNKNESAKPKIENPICHITRQRSKSEIETIYELVQYNQAQSASKEVEFKRNPNIHPQIRTKVDSMTNIALINPLSPSQSLKTISQPYQGKTMAHINKFQEDEQRDGCKSVLNKHKYANLSNFYQKQQFDGLGTNGIKKDSEILNKGCVQKAKFDYYYNKETTNQNQQLYHINTQNVNHKIEGDSQNINQVSSDCSSNNSPVLWLAKKSRQSSTNSQLFSVANFGMSIHNHSLGTSVQYVQMPKVSNNNIILKQTLNNNGKGENSTILSTEQCNNAIERSQVIGNGILKQRIQKSPYKKSMMTLNSSVLSQTNINNASILFIGNKFDEKLMNTGLPINDQKIINNYNNQITK